ncbi:cupin domain-containing protein [Micromonospora sp. NPDC049523]|uniref:cupin domain-containing protein n=1 Tax=Micromonospora sp. NPDC049523 TaxID=3155921 RepID=UPI0034485472
MTLMMSNDGVCYLMAGPDSGATVTTFIAASFSNTDAALVVMCTVVPPHEGSVPRVHEDVDESFYVLDGELQMTADGRSFTMAPGDYTLVPGGLRHAWRNPGGEPARVIRTCTRAGQEAHPFRVAGIGR